MVTFWLWIDTIAMIGPPASRGAAPSVVGSGRAWRGAAAAGCAAVSAVRAAMAASVTITGGAHRRTTSVDWAVVHRFVMPCPGCQGGIASKQTLRTGGWSLCYGPWSINTSTVIGLPRRVDLSGLSDSTVALVHRDVALYGLAGSAACANCRAGAGP